MSLEEAVFMRLAPRYARLSDDPPPFANASLDEALRHMREQLGVAGNGGSQPATRPATNQTARRSGSRPVHPLELPLHRAPSRAETGGTIDDKKLAGHEAVGGPGGRDHRTGTGRRER
jgi:hypothetical protein